MPRNRDQTSAVRVYTVCDESKYLIVSNVPALGCGDELGKLFSSYGDIEECKPMDDEDCEPFTDVYWIKFHQVNNARFAKRKLDEFVFLGNRLQVSYAPQYESLEDAKEKLEGRRKEVLARLNPRRSGGSAVQKPSNLKDPISVVSLPQNNTVSQQWNVGESQTSSHSAITRVTTNQDYFPSQSMNQTFIWSGRSSTRYSQAVWLQNLGLPRNHEWTIDEEYRLLTFLKQLFLYYFSGLLLGF